MFCKVCFDASKSDYKTHNVRDSASNVVCPLLLNTKCHKCGYFGHTTKYCKGAGKPPVATKAYVRPAVKVQVPVPVPVPKKLGAFACLEEEICIDADESETLSRETLSRETLSPAGVEELDFDKETIIWGVGFKSMIGKRWADVVGC
uniref:Nanos-type domain-containing protein n=1 Tax=viral metagenome TaxID=1070528 RepID=A0A6C0KSQ8_9ZZZZ